MSTEKALLIGELAARCGLSTRTVDYYTRLGLVEPAERTEGNYRLYEPDAVARLERVKQLQRQRLSLAEIRDRLTSEPNAPALDEIHRELESITGQLAVVGRTLDGGRLDPRSAGAVQRALSCALTISAYLQQLAQDVSNTPM